MIYVKLFIAFFIPSITGFGGGPSTIPLIQQQVVERYSFMSVAEFSSTIAIGNILPGPIATKLAGYIGYELAGVPGAVVAVFATVAPTTLMMILLLNIIWKYKDSMRVKRLTMFVIPIVGVLMLQLTMKFFMEATDAISWLPTMLLAVGSYIALQKFNVNAAIVIVSALVIGALFLA